MLLSPYRFPSPSGGVLVPTTLNPADKGTAAVLTEGNLLYNGDNTAAVRSIFSASSGKWYWECELAFVSLCGIANAAANKGDANPTYPGQDANSWAYYAYDGSSVHSGIIVNLPPAGFPSGSPGKVGIALDMDAGTLGFVVNNILYPAFTGLAGAIYAFVGSAGGGTGPWQNGYGCRVNFGATAFTHTVPAGYTSGFGPNA